jgi:hypothetical protein
MEAASRMTVDRQGRTQAKFSFTCRLALCAGGMALLSACASQSPPMTAAQEVATYQARAKPSYTPPGPPDDPWGPYIVEAAHRFDVPERWIRQVMRVESGSQQFTATGALTTSPVGAMGLMQLMPETYDEVRALYNLGDDAFDPHNNILAGTAYIRQMYDAFGVPGFLAAYNGGPARLQDYLVHQRPLPAETRRYVAMIGPYVQGIYPQSRAPAEQLAVNQLPIDIPAGPRYVVHHKTMLASRGRHGRTSSHELRYAVRDRSGHGAGAVELAEAPAAHVTRVAYVASPHHAGGLHLIASAEAAEAMPRGIGGRKWSVQTGSYGSKSQAHAAAGRALALAGHAHATVAVQHQGHATVYHARVSGLTHDAAVHACRKMAHHGSCLVVSPSA